MLIVTRFVQGIWWEVAVCYTVPQVMFVQMLCAS